MRFLYSFILLFIVVILCAFSMLNAQSVDVHYFWGVTQLPLVVLLLVACLFGMLSVVLLFIGPYLALKLRLRHAKQQGAKQHALSDRVDTLPPSGDL